jgi:hypothetical protein
LVVYISYKYTPSDGMLLPLSNAARIALLLSFFSPGKIGTLLGSLGCIAIMIQKLKNFFGSRA